MLIFSVYNGELVIETDTHITSHEITNVFLDHKLKLGSEIHPANAIYLTTAEYDTGILEEISVVGKSSYKTFFVNPDSGMMTEDSVLLNSSFIDWYNDIKGKEVITVSVDYSDGKVIFSGPLMQRVVCPPFVHYTKIINKKFYTTAHRFLLKGDEVGTDKFPLYITQVDSGITIDTDDVQIMMLPSDLITQSPAFTDWCNGLSKQQDGIYSKIHNH